MVIRTVIGKLVLSPIEIILERVKGIEPSYSAWKSGKIVVFSAAILTFSVFLAH